MKFFINRSTGNLSSWDLVPYIYSRERDCTDLRSAEYIDKDGKKKNSDHLAAQAWISEKEMQKWSRGIFSYQNIKWQTKKVFQYFFSKEYLKNNMFWKTHKARFLFSRHKAVTSIWQKPKEFAFDFPVFLHLLYNLLLVIFFHSTYENRIYWTYCSSNFSSMTNQEE